MTANNHLKSFSLRLAQGHVAKKEMGSERKHIVFHEHGALDLL